MIQCKNLSISFSGQSIFEGLNANLKEGNVYGLVGPNGSGKTTFLKMLTSLISPHTGEISFPKGSENLEPIGLSLEIGGFYENKSLRENLKLVQCLRGASESDVISALESMDISEKLALKKVGNMSQGQKQRSRIVSAILGWPSVVLFDEPNNGLDPEGFIQFRTIVRKLKEKKTTVVISSHLLSEIQELCDNVLFLIDGQLEEETVTPDKDLERLYLNKRGIAVE